MTAARVLLASLTTELDKRRVIGEHDCLDAFTQFQLCEDIAHVRPHCRLAHAQARGELLKLGHVVSATTIRNLLRRNRVGPAPLRSRQTWKSFRRAQASAIVLTDFFSVDIVAC